jgi:hypothetical protein
VPSSTSSSSEQLETARWLRAWLGGLLLAAVTLAGAELFWRSQGHGPSIVDDPALWAHHRERVYERGSQTIVLLGMSRMQLNVAIPTFRQRSTEYSVVQLAVAGRAPIAALRDLAEDEQFVGIVICGITPPGLLRKNRDRQEEYVRLYRRGRTVNARLNEHIGWFLQQHLVVLNPQVRLLAVAFHLFQSRNLPRPNYVTTHFDRSRSADFTKVEIVSFREDLVERARGLYEASQPPTAEEWLEEALETTPMVERIQERGGRVVFARFPTSGKHRDLDEQYYPRREYWDQFAAKTPALTIHFDDVPTLSRFELPDTSHLDYRDTAAFTEALVDELTRRGVLRIP